MHRSYKVFILYFLAFNALLLVSAMTIFNTKIGFLPKEVFDYYAHKTLMGILKVHLPHLLVFGLFGMVLLHFLVFTQYKNQTKNLAIFFFASAFLELLSPLLMVYGFSFFAYLKVFSFITFYLLIIYVSMLILFDIIIE